MPLFPLHITQLAEKTLAAARAKELKITAAESCTGGLIAGALTEIAGSSDVFERGFVTYSNQSKQDLLGVEEDTLIAFGAVSAETAAEMADGALDSSLADVAVSVTGVAGPGGGTSAKPVGLVYMGVASSDGAVRTFSHHFTGDRAAVRLAAVQKALELLLEEIENVSV